MFEPVSPSVSFPELDRATLAFWDREGVFEKSIAFRKGRPRFTFYEGPPTANGMPHPGHVLTRVMKDVFLRYRSACGYEVPRIAGWDTHGLPVEVEVEKELKISGRQAIEQYGVEAFTRKCIDSVFRYIDEWRRMTRRIGFWVDLDAAYVTFHASFVESVWWALSELYKQGLLYQDYKVVWWWPQGGTALSSGEVGQGYKMIDSPSIIVRFPVVGEEHLSLLAWTTTPWTLPSNVALAVNADAPYITAKLEDGSRVIVAEALQAKVLKAGTYEVEKTQPGSELVGLRYSAPFSYAKPEDGQAHVVVTGDFVTMDTGSGLVHIAPAFGEDDFRLAKQKGLGFLQLVQPNGQFDERVTDYAGRFCIECDRDIIRQLRSRGLLHSEEVYRHEYPFSWRRDTDPLIQYARRSWFIRTTREIHRTIENNQQVNWEPTHIKDGRFGSFLRSNVDWALSRERFWGTPLPVWVNDETGAMDVVASVAEIEQRNPDAFKAFAEAKKKEPQLSDHLRVHKPWIDEITWTKPGEPGVYRRVPEVIDCWFDSGCMPFAQFGYPHQNKEAFEKAFPADFITEAVDQTRGWFYSLMMVATLLFPEKPQPVPFRNCVVLGLITDEKGQKLSKSKKNYSDPMQLMEAHGGDAVRWALYTGTVPGNNTRFSDEKVIEGLRDFVLKVWNVYSFFVTYANIDGWDPKTAKSRPVEQRSDLDRWVLAELDATISEVRDALDNYKSHVAARRIEALVESISNWYVRRSRDRFWAEGDAPEKLDAFATLYEVLVDFTKLAAPFVPFLAETLYQNLVVKGDASAPASVHLTDYPAVKAERTNAALCTTMDTIRQVVQLGQRVRAEKKLKVRQPLSRAIIVVGSDAERQRLEQFTSLIGDELNVHKVELTQQPEQYVTFELVPNFRALGQRLGKEMPACKAALSKADGSKLYADLAKDGSIAIDLPSGQVQLTSEDLEVRLKGKADYAAAASGGHVMVLDTTLTEALRHEGLAREVINRLQRARKTMDLAYEARISVRYAASGELAQAIEANAGLIAGETLAMELKPGAATPTGAREEAVEVEGQPLTLWITESPAKSA
jgi:isoleucyl-tRNA synthetase